MKEVISEKSSFEEFEKTKRRRQLLPWWIKFFCWLFMIFGFFAFVGLLLGFTNIKPDLAFYGFETNEPFSLYGLIVISVALFKGYTAFSLWFEKDNGVKMGKIDAILGIVLCGVSMFILPFLQQGSGITIRLELLLLIPFLIKLNKIQNEWENSIN